MGGRCGRAKEERALQTLEGAGQSLVHLLSVCLPPSGRNSKDADTGMWVLGHPREFGWGQRWREQCVLDPRAFLSSDPQKSPLHPVCSIRIRVMTALRRAQDAGVWAAPSFSAREMFSPLLAGQRALRLGREGLIFCSSSWSSQESMAVLPYPQSGFLFPF